MTKYLIGITLLAGALYGVVQVWPLVRGPLLTIASPSNYESVPGGILTVEGRVLRGAKLTLGGSPLLYDQEGTFSSILTFPRGGSILTFEAVDRFGRKVTITRSLFVPPISNIP